GVVEGTRSDGESELSRRRTVARYNLIDVDHARCVQPASRDVGDISEQISSQLVLNVEVVLDGIRRSVVDVDCARARSRAGAEQCQESLGRRIIEWEVQRGAGAAALIDDVRDGERRIRSRCAKTILKSPVVMIDPGAAAHSPFTVLRQPVREADARREIVLIDVVQARQLRRADDTVAASGEQIRQQTYCFGCWFYGSNGEP